jgi:hypothetical protein
MRNLFFLVLLLLTYGCQQKSNVINANEKFEENANSKNSSNTEIINLDTIKSIVVDFKNVFKTNKNFEKPGEIDTFHIDSNIYCVKTSKFIKEDGETTYCYSQLEVFNKRQKVFSKDSILITGMYSYNKKSNLLSIPIITYQEADDLTTGTSLYICNVSNGRSKKIEEDLSNCKFALICSNGKALLYNNADKLIFYNLENKVKEVICNFDNPTMSNYKLSLKGKKLEIYYYNNPADIDVPMKETTINMIKPIDN